MSGNSAGRRGSWEWVKREGVSLDRRKEQQDPQGARFQGEKQLGRLDRQAWAWFPSYLYGGFFSVSFAGPLSAAVFQELMFPGAVSWLPFPHALCPLWKSSSTSETSRRICSLTRPTHGL